MKLIVLFCRFKHCNVASKPACFLNEINLSIVSEAFCCWLIFMNRNILGLKTA